MEAEESRVLLEGMIGSEAAAATGAADIEASGAGPLTDAAAVMRWA